MPDKPLDRTKFGFGLGNRQPKGHRHDREAPERSAIAAIAIYRTLNDLHRDGLVIPCHK